jgi:DnaJ-class molecular chaperone with C-terminal Zn finger domain
MNDPYEVLQVHRRAEPEVIRAAYRALARKYHPDFGGEPSRMIAITEAFSILGTTESRTAYDAQAARSQNRRSTDRKGTAPVVAHAGSAQRTGPNPPGSGSVIDFGRYAGWTIGSLVTHDPDYLEWLARTPIGRRLRSKSTRPWAIERSRRPHFVHRPSRRTIGARSSGPGQPRVRPRASFDWISRS